MQFHSPIHVTEQDTFREKFEVTLKEEFTTYGAFVCLKVPSFDARDSSARRRACCIR